MRQQNATKSMHLMYKQIGIPFPPQLWNVNDFFILVFFFNKKPNIVVRLYMHLPGGNNLL